MTLTVVTGTDTGVGKTITVAALAARGVAAGRSVVVVKPVQTGVGGPDPDVGDTDTVHRLTRVNVETHVNLDDPLAPDVAARRQGIELPPLRWYADGIRADVADGHDEVIVEGAGGLLVRLSSDGGTLLDLVDEVADLEPEVVVVARAGLGTLNHSELTVMALRARGIEPAGLVIGSWPASPGLAERCNLDDLPRVTGVPVLAVLPEGAGALPRDEFLAAAPAWFR